MSPSPLDLPAIASCPGLPACGPDSSSLCDDHKTIARWARAVKKSDPLYHKVAMARELANGGGVLDTWCVKATMDIPVGRLISEERVVRYEPAEALHRKLPKRVAAAVVAQYIFAGAAYAEWSEL